MKTVNCVVRIEDNHPIVFFVYDGELTCFTFKDCHNTSSREYMYSLPLAENDVAEHFLADYEAYCNMLPSEKIKAVLVKRLQY